MAQAGGADVRLRPEKHQTQVPAPPFSSRAATDGAGGSRGLPLTALWLLSTPSGTKATSLTAGGHCARRSDVPEPLRQPAGGPPPAQRGYVRDPRPCCSYQRAARVAPGASTRSGTDHVGGGLMGQTAAGLHRCPTVGSGRCPAGPRKAPPVRTPGKGVNGPVRRRWGLTPQDSRMGPYLEAEWLETQGESSQWGAWDPNPTTSVLIQSGHLRGAGSSSGKVRASRAQGLGLNPQ